MPFFLLWAPRRFLVAQQIFLPALAAVTHPKGVDSRGSAFNTKVCPELWYHETLVSLLSSKKLAPQEWVEALVSMEPAELDGEPFGPLLLLVRAPEDDDTGQFQKQLVTCVMKGSAVTGEHPKWPATAQFPTMNMLSSELTEADQIELLAELASAAHCIVPVRATRNGSGTLVGRSPQASVRLSDPSVSAEHAELLVEDGGLRIRDLKSKNGTTQNGRRLLGDECPWLQPMDRLTFGRIQAFACDPRVLRAVLRQGLRSLI